MNTSLSILFALATTLLSCTKKQDIAYITALELCAQKNASENLSLNLSTLDCVIGSTFPQFECTSISNEKIDQNYFKDRITIVNFWFEGCAPCVAEIPGFNQLAAKYSKEPLRFLAISRDSRQDVVTFLVRHPWDFDHVSDGESIIMGIFRCPWGYPTTFLVDQKGKIAKVIAGGASDSTAIKHIQEGLIPSIDRLLWGG